MSAVNAGQNVCFGAVEFEIGNKLAMCACVCVWREKRLRLYEWFSLFQYWMSTGTRFIIDWIIFCNHISCAAVAIASARSVCMCVACIFVQTFICKMFYTHTHTHADTYAPSLSILFSIHNWIVLDAKCNKGSLWCVLCILCSYFSFVHSTFVVFGWGGGSVCGNVYSREMARFHLLHQTIIRILCECVPFFLDLWNWILESKYRRNTAFSLPHAPFNIDFWNWLRIIRVNNQQNKTVHDNCIVKFAFIFTIHLLQYIPVRRYAIRRKMVSLAAIQILSWNMWNEPTEEWSKVLDKVYVYVCQSTNFITYP